MRLLNLWQSTSFVPSSNDRDYYKKNDREIFIVQIQYGNLYHMGKNEIFLHMWAWQNFIK